MINMLVVAPGKLAVSTKDILEKRLKELQRMVPEIEGAAVVSSDGLTNPTNHKC